MSEIITETLIQQHFEKVGNYLLDEKNRIAFELSREWCKAFSKDAGVYCFFVDGILGYVGETGCLRKRLTDLLVSRNHTLRRSIGHKYFGLEEGYMKASSSVKFPDHIEVLIEKWMPSHLQLSLLPIKIGRKEFEEWLQQKYPTVEFLNKRKKRQ